MSLQRVKECAQSALDTERRNIPLVVTNHPESDSEAAQVTADFLGYSNSLISDEVLDFHYDSIPLLTPEAFAYYFPRFVIRGVEHYIEGDPLFLELIVRSACEDLTEPEFAQIRRRRYECIHREHGDLFATLLKEMSQLSDFDDLNILI